MSIQRTYDKSTVNDVVTLAKQLIENGLLEDMTIMPMANRTPIRTLDLHFARILHIFVRRIKRKLFDFISQWQI